MCIKLMCFTLWKKIIQFLFFSFQIVELNTDEMVKPAPTCKYKFLVLEEPIILHIKKKNTFFQTF